MLHWADLSQLEPMCNGLAFECLHLWLSPHIVAHFCEHCGCQVSDLIVAERSEAAAAE